MALETIDIQDIAGSQSVTIPENFKINDNKVYLKKVGNTLYLIPFHNPWQDLIDSVSEFSEDFMNDREQPNEQPNEQTRESFD